MFEVIDTQAMPNCPTSRFLSRAEVQKLKGTIEMPPKVNYIFKCNIPVKIEDDQFAVAFVEKYPSLKFANAARTVVLEKKELVSEDDAIEKRVKEVREEMSLNSLSKLGRRYNLDKAIWKTGSKDSRINAIINCIREGAKLYSEEEANELQPIRVRRTRKQAQSYRERSERMKREAQEKRELLNGD